jgi:hypothetical protein
VDYLALLWDVLPSLRVHEYFDRVLFKKSYRKIHRAMDGPVKFFGKRHRELFHDSAWAYAIASRLYPNDPHAVLAALAHIKLDATCSRDPQYRKNLEALARLSSRRKRKRRRRTT